MRITLIYLIAIAFLSFMQAQNLVPSPSFEEFDICPNNVSQFNYAKYWYNPTLHSPDYYDSCFVTGIQSVDVPQNYFGYQNARTGYAYAGIGVAHYSDTREYIAIRLLNPLETGKKYCVEFYVSLADSVNYSTDDIGIYFQKDSIYANNVNALPFLPQIFNPENIFLSDKENWVSISGEFIAQGDEQYLVIGNFKDEANTDTIFLNNGSTTTNPPNYSGAYYYIDDVFVALCDTVNGVVNTEDFSLNVYPNPATGFVNIRTDKVIDKINLFSALGKSANKAFIKLSNGEYMVLFNDLSSGIYLLQIKTDKKIYFKEIFITH